MLICHYATLRQSAGDLPEYLALMEEAMTIARRAGDRATRAALALDLLYARLCHGSLAAAVDADDEALLLAGADLQMGADIVGYQTGARALQPLIHEGRAALPARYVNAACARRIVCTKRWEQRGTWRDWRKR